MFLSFPNFSISVNNPNSPNYGHRYNNQYYQNLLNKWINNTGSSLRERELLTDDNVIGDIVRNLFVEDQMFPGGKYGFTEGDLDKEDIYGQLGAPLVHFPPGGSTGVTWLAQNSKGFLDSPETFVFLL